MWTSVGFWCVSKCLQVLENTFEQNQLAWIHEGEKKNRKWQDLKSSTTWNEALGDRKSSVWNGAISSFSEERCQKKLHAATEPCQPADTWEEGGQWQGEAVLRHRQQGLTLTAIWETETNTQHNRHHRQTISTHHRAAGQTPRQTKQDPALMQYVEVVQLQSPMVQHIDTVRQRVHIHLKTHHPC